MQLSFATSLIAIAALISSVYAETHIVQFDNRCGYGTPTLIQNGNILANESDYTSNRPLVAAIAYLQTGNCGLNGEGCTLIETTLINTAVGTFSGSDISLIPPHAFSVASGFEYYGGCDGRGRNCTSANCPTAFHEPTDLDMVTVCLENNVNLAITFCN